MSKFAVESASRLGRFWRVPFVAGWLLAIVLLRFRAEQVDTDMVEARYLEAKAVEASHPLASGVLRSMQDHVDHIYEREHTSLVWFGIGIAVFVVCYFVSVFVTAGIRAPWRLISIDDKDVSNEASWPAQVTASIGAAMCAACIAVSYGIHWLE